MVQTSLAISRTRIIITFCTFFLDVGQEVQLYLSEFKISSSSDLDQRLDWDSKGVESDLIEIANDIPDWEEKLVAGLELTPVYVSDIKSRNPSKPRLQRCETIANN